MSEVEFEGIPSGDCECFCWEVTEEQYRIIVGEENYQREKEDRKESWHENRMKEMGNPPSPWRIYQIDLIESMGLNPFVSTKMKIKMTLEVIE